MESSQSTATNLDLITTPVDNSLEANHTVISDVILSQVNKLNISGENEEVQDTDLEKTIESNPNVSNSESGDVEEVKTNETVIPDVNSYKAALELNTDIILTNNVEGAEKIINQTSDPNDIVTSHTSQSSDNDKQAMVSDKIVNTPKMRVVTNRSAVIINSKSDSLRNLLVYDSDDSGTPCSLSDESEDEAANNKNKTNWQPRISTTVESGTSDSESDSTFEDVGSDEENTDDFNEYDKVACSDSDDSVKMIDVPTPKKRTPSKPNEQKKEEDLLPPVPDLSNLSINFEKEEFLHMGHVAAIVDKLVTVEALPGLPAYDLDSYLFIEQDNTKKPLGTIFDVLGPVTAPLYCVRFNAVADIQNLKLEKGMMVFVAPRSEYSKYVFVSELLKIKGTDASWKDDQERPDDLDDFSDDEKEHEAKRGASRPQLKRRHGSLERHQEYEKTMNQCNVLNTKVNRLLDGPNMRSRGRIRASRPMNRQPDNSMRGRPTCTETWNTGSVAAFDPSVPPPGFGLPVPPGVPQANQPQTPYASLPSVPPHMRGPNVPSFRPTDNSMFESAPWLPCEQPMRYPQERPNRGRGFNLLNRPSHRFYPPGPSSNNLGKHL